MSDLARRLAELSPQKRTLLERHLLRRRTPIPGIPRRTSSGPAPASFQQQQLWFLDQLTPDEPTYNAALTMYAEGRLNVAHLETAVTGVIARHEALRTVFVPSGSGLHQVVLENWKFQLHTLDLQGLDAELQRGRVEEVLRAEARGSFDLTTDLLLRVTVILLGRDRSVIAFIEHHIAFDGWSDQVLCDEIAEIYASLEDGREAVLPELQIQYADFSVWQRERLVEPMLADEVGFWCDYLDGAPSFLELPCDHPRPAVLTFSGAHLPVVLPAELSDRVRRLGESEDATVFMVLLAAVAAVLYRWTGTTDLVIGTPAANRGHLELEPLIGFFSNTLPIRITLDGSLTFRALVAHVRDRSVAALDHQELPFGKMVEAVNPPRHPDRNPLFQVNVRAHTGGPTRVHLPRMRIIPFDMDIGFSRFDLAIDLRMDDSGITGFIEYNHALFETTTIAGLGRMLTGLVTDATNRPDVALWDLEADGPRPDILGFRRRT